MLLVAEHLTKTYRHRQAWLRGASGAGDHGVARPALADASLTLERGESVGIVGESGSGKSTLARCLALLERPDAGRVLLEGADLTRLGRRPLRRSRRPCLGPTTRSLEIPRKIPARFPGGCNGSSGRFARASAYSPE